MRGRVARPRTRRSMRDPCAMSYLNPGFGFSARNVASLFGALRPWVIVGVSRSDFAEKGGLEFLGRRLHR
jgi:hypothetical protein